MLLDLDLRQFRCHAALQASFSPGWNVLVGANGEGKSSMLEAIYFLGRLKSFRSTQTRELVQWERPGFLIEAQQSDGVRTESLEVRWEAGRRACRIGGQPCVNVEEFWGRLPLVLVSADDVSLVTGPGSRRQQWLDSLIAHQDGRHLVLVQRYNLAVRQRNSWLRLGGADSRVGAALQEQVTHLGRTLTVARFDAVQRFGPTLRGLAERLWSDDRVLKFEYRPSFDPGTEISWERVRESELRMGRTMLGPHRDELVLKFRGQSLARYGSEGEQRLGSLLLRLTELQVLRGARGRAPLLLLDDVLNPLDPLRQLAWAREVSEDVQVIYATTTPPSGFASRKDSTVWELHDGALRRL